MPEILFENRGPVLIVTFNRPENGNALTTNMAKALHEKFKAAGEDRAVRAILLRGAGGNFMNGHDMAIYQGDMNVIADNVHQKIQFFYTAIREMQAMDKPIIAAVNGRVTGAGFNFMLASDLVIAGKNTVFNAGFTNYAMSPDGGATSLLARKAGMARAAEILMLSEDFSCDCAERYGLVSRIVDDAALESLSLVWAERVSSKATRAVGATKRLLSKAFEQDLNAQISLEANYWNTCSKSFDFREAMKAHFAKREAKFTGA